MHKRINERINKRINERINERINRRTTLKKANNPFCWRSLCAVRNVQSVPGLEVIVGLPRIPVVHFPFYSNVWVPTAIPAPQGLFKNERHVSSHHYPRNLTPPLPPRTLPPAYPTRNNASSPMIKCIPKNTAGEYILWDSMRATSRNLQVRLHCHPLWCVGRGLDIAGCEVGYLGSWMHPLFLMSGRSAPVVPVLAARLPHLDHVIRWQLRQHFVAWSPPQGYTTEAYVVQQKQRTAEFTLHSTWEEVMWRDVFCPCVPTIETFIFLWMFSLQSVGTPE